MPSSLQRTVEKYKEQIVIGWISATELFRTNKVSDRLRYSVFFFGIILLVGTVGYKLIGGEQASFFDGLYMTVITISTIGYTEVIDLKHSVPGRVFTILLAFTGIGFVTYMFSTIAALIIEGDLRRNFRKKQSERIISRMENHYIICGAGRVGLQIVEELTLTERPFSFADLDPEKVQATCDLFPNAFGIVGDCTENDFLEQLGIHQSKGVFVCTDDDNTNLVICLSAKQLNPKLRAVVMCKEPNYTNKLKSVGADRVISPYFIGGERMAAEMLRPEATNFLEAMLHTNDQNLRFEQIAISPQLIGRKLDSLRIDEFDSTLLIAFKDEKKDWQINPSKNQLIEGHSVIIVLTNSQDRLELENRCSG